MMKNLPAIIFCVFVCFNTFGQRTKVSLAEPKNEIGTHILSYSVYPFSDKYGRIRISNLEQKPFHLLNGLSYKRHINQHIIRTSFTYRDLKNNIYNRWTTGNYKEYVFKAGYERELSKTKITPYLAADIGFFYIDYEGSTAYENKLNLYNLHGFGGGISPAFGLKYKISRHLSLNAESCLDLVYFRYNHKESNKEFPNATFSTYKFDTRFNPLQKLSLNIKF